MRARLEVRERKVREGFLEEVILKASSAEQWDVGPS